MVFTENILRDNSENISEHGQLHEVNGLYSSKKKKQLKGK